jgi:putative tricarboxylic transport membrane protein
MVLHGLAPGPALFQTDLPAIYAIYIAIVISYIVTLVVQIWGIRWFVRVMSVPAHVMALIIIVMCVLGSYAIRNSMFDVYLMAIMGLIGYVLKRLSIPVAPVVLGLVLGGTLENTYRTALILNEGSYQGFLNSTVALVFFALTLLMIGGQMWSSRRKGASPAAVQA